MPENLQPGGALAQLAALLAKAWPFIAGFAGAVISLAFLDRLNPRGRIVAVLVGFFSAAFIAPGLAAGVDLVWPGDQGALPIEVAAAVHFVVGLSAMGALPQLIKWIAKVAGNPAGLGLLRLSVSDAPAGEARP